MFSSLQPIEVVADDAAKKEVEANLAKLATISNTVLIAGCFNSLKTYFGFVSIKSIIKEIQWSLNGETGCL